MAGEHVMGGRAVAAGRGWDWIASAWRLFGKAPVVWIAWAVTFLVLSLLSLVVGGDFGRLALVVVGPALMGGAALGCRELDAGRALKFGQLFAGFRLQPIQLLAVGLICALATVLISAGVILGSGVDMSRARTLQDVLAMSPAELVAILLVMLIILGLLVPVAMAAWFAPLLVVFDGMNAGVALRESFVANLRNVSPMLVYGLVLLPLAFVATIPVLLGWIALLPVLLASVYTSYKDIFTAE
ncbi:MAG: BPSS1780 family membrane protein [Burkholderiales bacterium]